MTGEMPAAHLARLRAAYPLYRIAFVDGSFGFAASRDGYGDIWALTLPQLEDKLRADRRGQEPRDGAMSPAADGAFGSTVEPKADGGPSHHDAWRRALDIGRSLYDGDVDEILGQGLPDTIRALLVILESIDERLGELEKRADVAGLPPLPDGIPDCETGRYLALYTLLARAAVPRTCACGGAS